MIHCIGPFVPYDSNIYLLTGDHNILIDTGTGASHASVAEAIEKIIGKDGKIDKILLTHCHVDHIGGVKKLVERYSSEVYAGCIDATAIRTADSSYTLDSVFGLELDPVDVIDLKDGDVIDNGDHSLRVMETPGHTAGGVSYFDQKSSSIFSGDTLFSNGVGRTDFPGGSIEQLRNSIKYIRDTIPKEIYPGHGPVGVGSTAVEWGLRIVGD